MSTEKKTNWLFVCEGNTNRSPTFERFINASFSRIEAKSCGTRCEATPFIPTTQIDTDLLEWADTVWCMDLTQVRFINYMYGNEYNDKIKIVGILDEFYPDEYALVKLIEFWLKFINVKQ
jgi:predicted protein tyrosine phosphatase